MNETNDGSFNLFTVALSLNKYTPPIYLDKFVVVARLRYIVHGMHSMGFFFRFFLYSRSCMLWEVAVCFYYSSDWVFKLHELLRPTANNTFNIRDVLKLHLIKRKRERKRKSLFFSSWHTLPHASNTRFMMHLYVFPSKWPLNARLHAIKEIERTVRL